jgi:hypothetical protein
MTTVSPTSTSRRRPSALDVSEIVQFVETVAGRFRRRRGRTGLAQVLGVGWECPVDNQPAAPHPENRPRITSSTRGRKDGVMARAWQSTSPAASAAIATQRVGRRRRRGKVSRAVGALDPARAQRECMIASRGWG